MLIILVIKNKSMKREFQQPMYKHIIINAVFNIVYCLIMVLKMINTCIFYGPSVFCSNVYQEIWAQQFKIIFIHFLGNAIKMCSNFSYLILSFSRLLLITKKKNQDLDRGLKHGNTITFNYVFLLILLGCSLSLFKLFQYRVNNQFAGDITNKGFPFEKRDEEYCQIETNKQVCLMFSKFLIVL
jgi:hypothetical protein